jgi:hypothetical protein
MHPTFTPGALWPDTEGVHINAHGGGMLAVGETIYWFGEHKVAGKAGNKAMVGVSCYSSRDLVTWRNEGIVLPVVMDDLDHDLIQGCVIERPKVIHNPRTGQYVMWFHLELKGQGYAAASAGVAVSDRPTGPYTYLGSRRPDDAMSRDMTLFVDDVDPWPDGTPKAYLFCASEDNATMHVSLLTGDYLAPAGKFERIFIDRFMEAPAVFKHQGSYYFVGSGCTGWAPNAARSAVAPSVWGPWTELGNPCRGPNEDLTFGAQSTYVLPVPGLPDAFIFMADEWRPENAIDGRYVWLPIRFEADGERTRFVVPWREQWSLDEF